MSKRFALTLIGVLAVLGLVVWIASLQSTLIWVANHAAQRTAGQLNFTGLTGSLLYGPIGFERIQYRTPGVEVVAERGSVDIARWRLLSREVLIRNVEADTVSFEQHRRAQPEPAKLPDRLRLPWDITVESLQVHHIVAVTQGIAIGPLAASAQARQQVWSALISSLQTPLGTTAGQMRIATERPFALDGAVSLTRQQPAYKAKAQISGTLERIGLKANANAKDATAIADAIVTLFAPGPIEHLNVDVRNVDPRYFLAELPNASLALRLTADRDSNGERMRGAWDVSNDAPGTWDLHKLPFVKLKGAIEGTPADLALNDLLFDLGQAGKLAGTGHVRGKRVALDLTTPHLDMSRVYARMRSTQFAGSIRAKASDDVQHLALRLKQQNGRIDVDAFVRNGEFRLQKLRAAAAGGSLDAHGKLGLEGKHQFVLKGTVRNFDPSRFGKFARSRINSRFDAIGALAPVLQVKADVDVFDSELNGMATNGKIRWHSSGTSTPDVTIDLAADVGSTRASAKGTLYDPVHIGKMDIQLALQGNDLADLYPILGIPMPPTPAYNLSGHLQHHDDVWTFKQFSGKVGESDLAGDFMVQTGRALQVVRAELVSDTLRLVDLSGFIGARTAGKPHAKRVKGQPILPNEPFNLEKIRVADADVKFTGRRVITEGVPIDNMTAHLRALRGVVTIDPLDFGVGGGNIVGKVTLDAQRSVIAATADMRVDELQLQRLVPKVKSTKASIGTMEGRAQLSGTGNSVAAMLGTANGQVTLLMDGGEISDLVLRLLNLDIAHATVAVLRGDQSIPVRCMVGHFEARNGHLKPAPFILDTEHTKVAIEGDIDLGAEMIDLRLIAQPKDMSLASLRGPILIQGPFDSASARPDLKRAIARGVAAVTLGIVATPVAALVPLFEIGTEKDANCKAIVAQTQALIDQEPGARPPTPDATEATGESRRGGG